MTLILCVGLCSLVAYIISVAIAHEWGQVQRFRCLSQERQTERICDTQEVIAEMETAPEHPWQQQGEEE